MGIFGRKRRATEPTEAPVAFEFGFPTRCPECGDRGYLDFLDLTHRVMRQHCPSCWARWETSEDQLTSTA